MVLGGIQAFNLVSILLLLVPGWLGVKLYLDGVERSDRLGRIDTVVVSILVSLCGLLILAAYYTLWVLLLTLSSSPWYPTVQQLSPLVQTPVLVIINYMNLTVVSSVLGLYCACSGRLIGKLPEALNKAWRTRLEAVEGSPGDDRVQVVTTDGDRITGTLGSWSVDSRDLVIEQPEWTDTDFGGEEHTLKSRDGSVFVRGDRVARVYVDEPRSGDRRDQDTSTGKTKPNDSTDDLVETAESSDSQSDER